MAAAATAEQQIDNDLANRHPDDLSIHTNGFFFLDQMSFGAYRLSYIRDMCVLWLGCSVWSASCTHIVWIYYRSIWCNFPNWSSTRAPIFHFSCIYSLNRVNHTQFWSSGSFIFSLHDAYFAYFFFLEKSRHTKNVRFVNPGLRKCRLTPHMRWNIAIARKYVQIQTKKCRTIRTKCRGKLNRNFGARLALTFFHISFG